MGNSHFRSMLTKYMNYVPANVDVKILAYALFTVISIYQGARLSSSCVLMPLENTACFMLLERVSGDSRLLP